MEIDFNFLTSLWKNYSNASLLLTKAMGGIANEVGEFAERLVAEYYQAEQLTASNKSADLKKGDTLIQVKSRKIDKLKTTSLNVIRSWDFDILVVVLFSKDGNILKGIEINAKDAQQLATSNSHQNGYVITTNNAFLNHPNAVDITSDLQSLIDGQKNNKSIINNFSHQNSTPKTVSHQTKTGFDRIYEAICEDLKSESLKTVGSTLISIDEKGKIRFGNTKRTESKENMELLFNYFIQNRTTQLSFKRDDWFSLIEKLTEGNTKTIDYKYYSDFLQEMLNRYYKFHQNKIQKKS